MSTLNKHDKAVQTAMKAMSAGGAKFPNWGKALRFLSPLLTAKMLFEGLRQIPGIGDVMEKIDDLDAWVTKNTLGRVPVLKWNTALGKAAKNWMSGGDKGIKDYIHEGNEDSNPKEEDNDRSWYEPGYQVSIPTNEARPVDLNMVPLFTPNKSFLGGIAKLAKLCVSGYSMYKSKSIRNTIQTIFKSMRDNLKSNLTYDVNDVTCVLLNNISIYIMEKHLERRLGYTKFEDPEFKSFYDLWKKRSLTTLNYGIHDLTDNPNLDVTSVEFGVSMDIYEKLVNMSDRCILPSHFKAWIDHYFGSVMIIDDDVANKKYMVVSADNVPFYHVENGAVVEETMSLDDDILSPQNMYDFIDSYFHETKVATIISDYQKAASFGKLWNLSGFTTGWLTSMRDYKPTPIIDKGFKQALINAYTSDGHIGDDPAPSYYRLDRIDGVNDDLTTYLFLGKLFNTRRNVAIYGTKTWEANRLEVLIYADQDTPVYLPVTLTQAPVAVNSPRVLTETNPFAITIQTDISADIYVGANVSIAETTTRYYGPTNAYPKETPPTTEITCNIKADRNFTLKLAAPVGLFSVPRDVYFFLPLVLSTAADNSVILFYKKVSFSSTTILGQDLEYSGSGSMGNLYYCTSADGVFNFLTRNQLLPCFTFDSYADDEHTSTESYGAVGKIIIRKASSAIPNSLSVTFDWYSMTYGNQSDSPAPGVWLQYSLYPNSDVGSQYCLVTEETTTVKSPSINYGYVQMAATLFTMLGYSIPMYQNLKLHLSVLSETYTDINVNQILLKEDYIPFYINADDFPYIIDTMFDGLFNYKVQNDPEVKAKDE